MPPSQLTFTGRVIAVTGARTFLGSSLLRLLEADKRYDRIIALDVAEPEVPLARATYVALDLLAPDAEQTLLDALLEARVDTLVHAAFLSHPTHALGWAHELEDVGTMQVLGAAERAQLSRVAMTSSTLVYGASPENPVEMREDVGLETSGKPSFLVEKIRAERQLAEFATRHPSLEACAIRFAPIVGPTSRSFLSELLAKPLFVRMLGYDPLVQMTDEGDAARAFKAVVDRGVRGPINIASRGVLPLSTVLALLGRVPLPIPSSLLRPFSKLLWTAQLSTAPPEMIDFLRYLCVADIERADAELGIRPRHHIRDLLRNLADPIEGGASAQYASAIH